MAYTTPTMCERCDNPESICVCSPPLVLSRDDVLEEAALICEAMMGDRDESLYRTAIRDCALAIRQGKRHIPQIQPEGEKG